MYIAGQNSFVEGASHYPAPLPSATFNQSASLPSCSREDEEVKMELKKILRSHFDDVIELLSSLTQKRRESLWNMDSEGLVWELFEAIKADWWHEKKFCIRNLYIYFYKKGYRQIALEPLECTEVML